MASKDIDKYAGEAISSSDENQNPDQDMEFSARENASIKNKDGALGKAGCGAIDGGSGYIALREESMSIAYSLWVCQSKRVPT